MADRQEKLKYIANHYGFEKQSRQCVEEMAELTKAICKYHRAETAHEKLFAMRRIDEELADVEIMVSQLKMFCHSEIIEKEIEHKIKRQLKRIKEESGQHD